MGERNEVIEKYVKLEKIRFGISAVLTEEFICDQKLEVIEDYISRYFVFQLRGFIYGEHLGKKSIRRPKDWWEYFKKRWFPRSLLKRFPVKEEVIEFSAYELYPNFKPYSKPSFPEIYMKEEIL